MAVNMDISGFDKLIKALDDKVSTIETEVENTVYALAEQVAGEARDHCPANEGRLRESIFPRVIKDKDGEVAGEVCSNLEYAAYVEFGTGPVGEAAGLKREGIDLTYRQTPWVYQDEEGKYHYTRGREPKPFMYKALKQSEEDIKEKLGSVARLELK